MNSQLQTEREPKIESDFLYIFNLKFEFIFRKWTQRTSLYLKQMILPFSKEDETITLKVNLYKAAGRSRTYFQRSRLCLCLLDIMMTAAGSNLEIVFLLLIWKWYIMSVVGSGHFYDCLSCGG